MSLIFEINDEINIDESIWKVLAEEVIEKVIDYIKCPFEVELNLYITDDLEMKSINYEQRGIDNTTDVLSFPMIEWPQICEFSWLEDDEMCFHPESGELILGDIILSFPKIIKQSTEYNHSLEREYVFLIVHSILHLVGYDHMIEEDRLVMEEKQNEIMDYLGIYR